jgi:uncharacterized membrane protein YphA (DoxX/SURF4 family)
MTLMWFFGRLFPLAALVLAVFVIVNAIAYVRKAFFRE